MIGGVQLTHGYLKELTATAFLKSPFIPGERIYKTGDISLYRSDGIIEYCGHADCQIKLCGQCTERGEIEDTIAKHSTVQSKRAATVIRTVQDPPAIVAFVEFNDVLGEHLGEEKQALKAFFSVRLPWFMYPIAYRRPSSTFMSHNGKIDCNALKLMDLKAFSPDLNRAHPLVTSKSS